MQTSNPKYFSKRIVSCTCIINGINTYVFLPQLFELLRQTSTTHLIVFILFKLFYQVIPTKNKFKHTGILIRLKTEQKQFQWYPNCENIHKSNKNKINKI